MSSSSARRSARLSLIKPPQPVLLTTAREPRPPQPCRHRLRGGRLDPGQSNSFVEGHPSPLPSRPLPSLSPLSPLPSRPLLVLPSWPLLLPSPPR
jgi:hypothetical protein